MKALEAENEQLLEALRVIGENTQCTVSVDGEHRQFCPVCYAFEHIDARRRGRSTT